MLGPEQPEEASLVAAAAACSEVIEPPTTAVQLMISVALLLDRRFRPDHISERASRGGAQRTW